MSNKYFHDNGLPKIGLLCEPYVTPLAQAEPLRAFAGSINRQHCHSCLSIIEVPVECTYFCVLKERRLPVIPSMTSSRTILEDVDWVTHMIWHNEDIGDDGPIPLADQALTQVTFKLCSNCRHKADELYKSHEVKPGSSYLVEGSSWDDLAHSLACACK